MFQILFCDIISILQVSDQFVTYSNQLVYPESTKPFPLIIHGYRWRVDVNCDLNRFEHVTQHYKPTEAPLTQTTIHHQIGGTGHYDIMLQFFTDPQYFHEINVRYELTFCLPPSHKGKNHSTFISFLIYPFRGVLLLQILEKISMSKCHYTMTTLEPK